MLMDELAEDPVWRSIAKVCMAVALIAVLFNMTTQWELEGHFQTWSFVRKSIAKVVSSGTVWAGVAVYAGWKLSRPTVAFLGGIVVRWAWWGGWQQNQVGLAQWHVVWCRWGRC